MIGSKTKRPGAGCCGENGSMVVSHPCSLGRNGSYSIGFDERWPRASHESQLIHACGHRGTAVVHNADNTALLPSCLSLRLRPGRSAGTGLRAAGGVGVNEDVLAGVEQRLDVLVLDVESHRFGSVNERIGRVGAGMRDSNGFVPGVMKVWL